MALSFPVNVGDDRFTVFDISAGQPAEDPPGNPLVNTRWPRDDGQNIDGADAGSQIGDNRWLLEVDTPFPTDDPRLFDIALDDPTIDLPSNTSTRAYTVTAKSQADVVLAARDEEVNQARIQVPDVAEEFINIRIRQGSVSRVIMEVNDAQPEGQQAVIPPEAQGVIDATELTTEALIHNRTRLDALIAAINLSQTFDLDTGEANGDGTFWFPAP